MIFLRMGLVLDWAIFMENMKNNRAVTAIYNLSIKNFNPPTDCKEKTFKSTSIVALIVKLILLVNSEIC